jgi:hypothetical protein
VVSEAPARLSVDATAEPCSPVRNKFKRLATRQLLVESPPAAGALEPGAARQAPPQAGACEACYVPVDSNTAPDVLQNAGAKRPAVVQRASAPNDGEAPPEPMSPRAAFQGSPLPKATPASRTYPPPRSPQGSADSCCATEPGPNTYMPPPARSADRSFEADGALVRQRSAEISPQRTPTEAQVRCSQG